MSCLREVQTISKSLDILPMPSLTRLTTGGVLNPLKNTTNTSHNELLHQDPLQPPLEPRRLDTHMELPQHARMHETAPASSLLREGTRPGPGLGSRAQSPTDVQLRPRILPVRVRRQFAITTTRGMIPNSQRDGGMGPVTPAL